METASTGASLTGRTVMLLSAVTALNAVVPPLMLALAVAPAMPLLRSQARKLKPELTVPFQSACGTKRTDWVASLVSRRALPSLTAPNAVQTVPPSSVYCQLPWVSSTPVTAMPESAPASTSVMLPAISSDTRVPGLLPVSSSIACRSLALASSGASLTATTPSWMLCAALSAIPSLTVSTRVRCVVSGVSLVLA